MPDFPEGSIRQDGKVHRFRRGVGRIVAAVAELGGGEEEQQQEEQQAGRGAAGRGAADRAAEARAEHAAQAVRAAGAARPGAAAGGGGRALRVVPYYHTGADQAPP